MEHQYSALQRQAQREGAQIHPWRRDGPALGPSDRHPALSGVRGQFHHRGISGLFAPLGALGATQGVSDCGSPSGASSPPRAAVGAQHADQIELFYLPPYSPERNPDEYLNQEIKAHVRRQRRPHHVAGLKRMVRAYLHQLQQWPEKLSHFFWLPQVQDAGI